jgi:hypothetical protein
MRAINSSGYSGGGRTAGAKLFQSLLVTERPLKKNEQKLGWEGFWIYRALFFDLIRGTVERNALLHSASLILFFCQIAPRRVALARSGACGGSCTQRN